MDTFERELTHSNCLREPNINQVNAEVDEILLREYFFRQKFRRLAHARPYTDGTIVECVNKRLDLLKDPYTFLVPPEFNKVYQELDDGVCEQGGVGIDVSYFSNVLFVERVYNNTPAAAAGITRGAVITAINGQAVDDTKSFQALIASIQGAVGTHVALTINQNGSVSTVSLTRQTLLSEAGFIESQTRHGVHYVLFNGFSRVTLNNIIVALQSASSATKGIILDLRKNSGGLMVEALAVAGAFKNGLLFLTDNNYLLGSMYFNSGAQYEHIPLVILTSKDTASAAEIVAAAVKDRAACRVIGDPTFGKSEICYYTSLKSYPNATLQYTGGEWRTPEGTTVKQSNGVQPHFSLQALLDGESTGVKEVDVFLRDLLQQEDLDQVCF